MLLEVRSAQTGRGLVDDRTILRSIGQVPLERAARYLMDLGKDAQGLVQGQPRTRWFAASAGNTGRAGMAYIRSLWAIRKRIPCAARLLVMAGTFEKSEDTRAGSWPTSWKRALDAARGALRGRPTRSVRSRARRRAAPQARDAAHRRRARAAGAQLPLVDVVRALDL